MQFEWDEAKAASNKVKHGVSFDTASLVWDDQLHGTIQDRVVDGEQRWHAIGMASPGVLLVVTHSHPDGDDERVRIISARRASRRERKMYEEEA